MTEVRNAELMIAVKGAAWYIKSCFRIGRQFICRPHSTIIFPDASILGLFRHIFLMRL